MKLFRKKSKKEIVNAFLIKYNIPMGQWNELQHILKTPHNKHFILFWGIPMIIIGIALFLSLFVGMMEHEFPLVFVVEDITFYQRFINVLFGISQFTISLLFIIIPSIKMNKIYNW